MTNQISTHMKGKGKKEKKKKEKASKTQYKLHGAWFATGFLQVSTTWNLKLLKTIMIEIKDQGDALTRKTIAQVCGIWNKIYGFYTHRIYFSIMPQLQYQLHIKKKLTSPQIENTLQVSRPQEMHCSGASAVKITQTNLRPGVNVF